MKKKHSTNGVYPTTRDRNGAYCCCCCCCGLFCFIFYLFLMLLWYWRWKDGKKLREMLDPAIIVISHYSGVAVGGAFSIQAGGGFGHPSVFGWQENSPPVHHGSTSPGVIIGHLTSSHPQNIVGHAGFAGFGHPGSAGMHVPVGGHAGHGHIGPASSPPGQCTWPSLHSGSAGHPAVGGAGVATHLHGG